MQAKGEQDYPEAEAQRRFEQALRAAVTTPPVPMKDRVQGPRLDSRGDASEHPASVSPQVMKRGR